MKTEQEIDAMLSKLRKAWTLNPELRLGQLIVNAATPAVLMGHESAPQIFYIEDQKLADGLSMFYESRRARNLSEALTRCESRCLDNENDRREVASEILSAKL